MLFLLFSFGWEDEYEVLGFLNFLTYRMTERTRNGECLVRTSKLKMMARCLLALDNLLPLQYGYCVDLSLIEIAKEELLQF